MKPDIKESLNFRERWQRDFLNIDHPAVAILSITIDMTRAFEYLEELRRTGVAATHTHLVVRAAARALAVHTDLHQIVAGNRRMRPGQIDIGLSVSGDTPLPPVLVLSDADRKSVAELVEEIARRAPEAQELDRRFNVALGRWGWLLPFGFLRRAFLRRLVANNLDVRRKLFGALGVSMVPADWGATCVFGASGTLIGGRIQSRVTVVGGQPAVRPMMSLTFSNDHRIWNGSTAMRLLSAIKEELEKETL
jgi:pyruvate/2-oxoglutarate dehydrogenase complex dihydrolipoamide acyltransferase (E2) component